VPKVQRLGVDEIDEILRGLEAGKLPDAGRVRALCGMARTLRDSEPSQELIRLATLLLSSRGALPLKSSQAEALGAAVLRAAQGLLLENAVRGLEEARSALVIGRNWIGGLERIRPSGKIGPQVVGLAKSMTKTMYRHLIAATEALNFGIAGPIEPLERADPSYREIPPFAQIVRRKGANEAEEVQEMLRVARLGILKLARFIHAIGVSDAARLWDEALAREAAAAIADADAHLRALPE